MFKNYLKTALRNIFKYKGYTFINISGLAVGLAMFILLAVIVGFDTEADRFHQNSDRIYSVIQVLPSVQQEEKHTAFTPNPMLKALQNEFPEIEQGTRAFLADKIIVKYRDKIFYENRMMFTDPNFLSVFSFHLIKGDPSQALAEPFSIVLSKDMAKKYFGDSDPMGKVLTLDNNINVTVKGVLDFIDDNYSSLYFESLISLETAPYFAKWANDWKTNKLATFLLLSKDTRSEDLENKFPLFLKKYYPPKPDTPKKLYLLSLLDFRLHSNHIDSFWHRTDSFLSFTLIITGTLILLIVSINFVNLSTARYMIRIKEVGLRKVVGARRSQLIKQFLSESVILALIALPLSLVIYNSMLHIILRLLIHYQGEFSVWNHPFLYKYLLGVVILVGILTGLYPALFLSSFHPVKILKGKIQTGRKGSRLRRLLVISQYTTTIILIILTLSWKQLHQYFFKADLGYNRKNVITVKLTEGAPDKIKELRDAFQQHTEIMSVTASANLPISWENQSFAVPEGLSENEALTLDLYDVDYHFLQTLGMRLKQGRGFHTGYNNKNHVIINDILAQRLNTDNPLGKQLTIEGEEKTIIGVTDYYHFKSVNLPLGPAVMRLNPERCNYMLIKYSAYSDKEDIVNKIRQDWNIIMPDTPFESYTLNDHFYDDFSGDRTFLIIFGVIVGMAIFISCLGLLGLATYSVQRRTKEIGIRKTLGASITGIIRLLISEFFILVLIANLIGIPVAYFICKSLFQYRIPYVRIPAGIEIYAVTLVITVVTAAIAIITQTLRAARANPVESLRYE